jgi:hypothetical protein
LKQTVVVTAAELREKGLWDRFCDLVDRPGSGLTAGDTEFSLTTNQAKHLGLLDQALFQAEAIHPRSCYCPNCTKGLSVPFHRVTDEDIARFAQGEVANESGIELHVATIVSAAYWDYDNSDSVTNQAPVKTHCWITSGKLVTEPE